MDLSIPNIAEIKSTAREAMSTVFDFWKRDTKIRIYKSAKNEFTVVDPNYRHSLGGTQANTISVTPTYEDFDARVIYVKPEELSRTIVDGGQIANQGNQLVKVQLKEDGHSYLGGAERVMFLSEKFKMTGDVQKIGIMGDPQFYQYIFEEVN